MSRRVHFAPRRANAAPTATAPIRMTTRRRRLTLAELAPLVPGLAAVTLLAQAIMLPA